MTTVADVKRAISGRDDNAEIIIRNKQGQRVYDVTLSIVEKESIGCLFG